jgi:hypothetical protein
MKVTVISLCFAALFGSVYGQDVNKLISQTDIENVIKTLSADNMQGRAVGTPGIEKAAEFIESQFKQTELSFFPGDKGYRQNFNFTKTMAGKTLVQLDGKLIPEDSVLTSTGSPGFSWNNNPDVEIVKLAAGQNFRQEYLKYLGSGKKMLIVVDPEFTAIFNTLKERFKKGTYALNAGNDRELVLVLGNYNKVKSFQVTYSGKSDQVPVFNIVGVIPGKAKPEEYIIFSGHYDHLGILKPVKGDSIANGADDDASGTTAVIELAKYFKALNNNARTLVFVAFTGEEVGELGSQHFATTVDPDKIVAMFNIEMIGKASKFGENSAFITGFDRSDFGSILQKNLNDTPFKFYPDPYPEQNLFLRSDNASLAKVGVPAHTISTDQIDIDKYYHTVKDEFSTLDVNNITATIRAIALSSRTIVSGQDTPTRVAKEK